MKKELINSYSYIRPPHSRCPSFSNSTCSNRSLLLYTNRSYLQYENRSLLN